MNKATNQFTILASSDLDYEKMVVNLNFDNNQVAVLNCDKGIDQAEIKIFDRYEDRVIWTFKCKDFMVYLNKAYEELNKINS